MPDNSVRDYVVCAPRAAQAPTKRRAARASLRRRTTAFLLAAGLGTRLRPLTDRVPKCLVSLNGRPLLAYWFDLLERHRVRRVLVNTHSLPDQVRQFVVETKHQLEITLSDEGVLLGTAGTIKANRHFVSHQQDFLVLYADNLTNVDLTSLMRAHRRGRQLATLGLFRTPDPCQCGIVTLDERGIITSFEEKPVCPRSNLAFAGLLVASPAIFDFIPDQVPCDLGHDVLPRLIGRMVGVEINAYLRDIGSPESYAQAQREVPLLGRGPR